LELKKNSNNKLNRILNNRSSSSSSDFLSKNWLYCRWVLYTVFLLSIGNIYYLLLGGDYFTLAVFILVAFLTTFFSKNMVVILCISLVISTILKSVQVKEGLELSKNDLNTIEQVIGKIGGVGKEGNTDKKNSKDDSDKTEESEDNSEEKEKDSEKTDSKKTDSEKTDSKKTDSKKTDSEKTDSKKTDSEKTDSKKTDSKKTDSKKPPK
jgi:hypothetical protein